MVSKLHVADWMLHTLYWACLFGLVLSLAWLAVLWLDRVLFGDVTGRPED